MKNDGVENNFELNKFNVRLVGGNYQGAVSYFSTYNDALNNS
jgi:hypothetical protein